jgi:hypothetical protein
MPGGILQDVGYGFKPYTLDSPWPQFFGGLTLLTGGDRSGKSIFARALAEMTDDRNYEQKALPKNRSHCLYLYMGEPGAKKEMSYATFREQLLGEDLSQATGEKRRLSRPPCLQACS